MEITLSAAEIFSIGWAIGATVYAGWCYFEVKKLAFMLLAISLTLRDIADGKATAEMKDEQIIIERILPLRKNEG